jgi:hypothetical protein
MKIEFAPLNLLTIVFVTLKLTNQIDWSWWWVLSPTLFLIAIFVIVLFLLVIGGLTIALISFFKK